MKISKNTKIFLIIFSTLLLLITISAILYKRFYKEENTSQIIIETVQKIPELDITDVEKQNSNSQKLTLNDTYSNNGLTYKTLKDTGKEIDVEYIQISGLIDESIQENINSQIRERINKILDSNNFKRNSNNSAYVRTTVEANFSDVLSIKIFVQFNETFSKSYGLNFNLANGEKLKLDDLFTYDAPKKNIITTSAYRSFALNYYTNEGILNDFYINIEDEIIDFLENYNNGEITEFSFTPLTIELYKNGKTVSIDMAKNYKYIAIYTEHVSNTNLYKTSENVAKKIPVFIKRAKSIYDLYEKINDTCIIDVIIYSDEEFSAKEKNVIENYKKDLENRISSLKVQKGIYYSNYVKITRSKEKNENILLFNEAEAVAKTDENKFVTEVYPKIISAERDINNINYNKSKINILDKKMITEKSVQKKYSLKTEKEIVEVVDEVDKTTIEENNANIENNQNEENTSNNANSENVVQTSPVVPSPNEEPVQTTEPSPTPSVSGNVTTKVYF